jgi:hypothetical protein
MAAYYSPVDGPPNFDLHVRFVSAIVGETMKTVQNGKTHRYTNDMYDPLCVFAMKCEERVEKHSLNSTKWFEGGIRYNGLFLNG